MKLTKQQKALVEALKQGAQIHKPVLWWQSTHSVKLGGQWLMEVQRSTLEKLEAAGVISYNRKTGHWKAA